MATEASAKFGLELKEWAKTRENAVTQVAINKLSTELARDVTDKTNHLTWA